MGTQADYAAQMIAALAVSEPELDTSVGSVTRKIIDAVSEVAGSADVDRTLLDYQFFIDTKTGDDLDDFVLNWGFTRFAAKRATGVVRFSRATLADRDYPVPQSTQVTTATSPTITFATVAPATLQKGSTSVDVPIQAVLGGEASNLTAGTLTVLATPVNGVSAAVTNLSPTSGGTNAESDADLIARFKRPSSARWRAPRTCSSGWRWRTPPPTTQRHRGHPGERARGSSAGASRCRSPGTARRPRPSRRPTSSTSSTAPQFFGTDLDAGPSSRRACTTPSTPP
jgi:hypothetical protein